MRTAIITKIKGLSIQALQNTFVLFTLFKLTLDERKTLTKISTCKPLTTVPQTSAHLRHERTRKPANRNLRRKAFCNNNTANISLVCTSIECNKFRTSYDGQIDTSRHKHAVGIQYKHESKEDIAGFISKPVARPEYGKIYQHKGMLIQNLHRRYLYILIKLPNLLDLEQRIPDFPN